MVGGSIIHFVVFCGVMKISNFTHRKDVYGSFSIIDFLFLKNRVCVTSFEEKILKPISMLNPRQLFIIVAYTVLVKGWNFRSFRISSVITSYLPRIAVTLAMMGNSVDAAGSKYPIYADDSIMNQKQHGTCTASVQKDLRWGCSIDTADRICCFNRHYAEYSGYWTGTKFLDEVDKNGETTFYDSVTGKPLFIAPRGRTFEEFQKESLSHGWPSFRDDEVVKERSYYVNNSEC